MKTELTDEQKAYVKGLRDMADFLEERPEFIGTPIYVGTYIYKPSLEMMAAKTKALSPCNKVADDIIFSLERKFGPHKVKCYTNRDAVCEKRTVTKTIEVEEWVCPSILAGAEAVTA